MFIDIKNELWLLNSTANFGNCDSFRTILPFHFTTFQFSAALERFTKMSNSYDEPSFQK